jgi:hypothetical protein
MTLLGPEARRLIAATKTADDPSRADRARMRERLDSTWASSANGPVAPQGFTLGTKLIVSAVVLGLSGLGALQLARTRSELSAVPASLVQSPASAVSMRVLPPSVDTGLRTSLRGEPANAEAPANAVAASEPSPARVHVRTPRAPRTAARPAAPPNAAPPQAANSVAAEMEHNRSPEPPSARVSARVEARPPEQPPQRKPSGPVMQQVDDELALLGAAQDALQSGKPSLTLQLAQQHAFRFPRGALDRERLTVEALALCALQRKAAARQVLNELARRAPESPVLARIRADCGFDSD